MQPTALAPPRAPRLMPDASPINVKSKQHSHLGKVFISHAAVDKRFVRRLGARIESNGYDVWLDEHDLLAGDPLAQQIGEALKRAKVVLVVVSKASVASRWLRYEVDIATQRMIAGQCRVIPVVIDDSDLPPEVRGLLYADCRTSLRAGWKSIQTALQHEAERSLAEESFYFQAERLLKRFFTTGFTFSIAEYGDNDFNIISLEVKDQKGNDIDVPYETVDSHTTPAKPLSDDWWDHYSAATERMPHPYSFMREERLEIAAMCSGAAPAPILVPRVLQRWCGCSSRYPPPTVRPDADRA